MLAAVLLFVGAVLLLIGLVMILSASSVQALTNYGSAWYVFERQFAWALIGLVGFFVSSKLDYHVWQRYSRLLLAIGFVGGLIPAARVVRHPISTALRQL